MVGFDAAAEDDEGMCESIIKSYQSNAKIQKLATKITECISG